MRTIRPRGRHYLAALALAACIALGLAAPFVFDLESNELKLSGVMVFAAPRDQYDVATPLHVKSLPGLVLRRGTILLVDAGAATGRPAGQGTVTAAARDLLIDGGALSMSSRAGPAPPPGEAEVMAPLVEALTGSRLDTLALRNCTLEVELPDGRVETLTDVTGEFSFKRRPNVAVKGSGRLRGHLLSFEASTNYPPDRKPGPLVPLRLRLKSPLLEVSFDGRLDATEGVQLQGLSEVSVTSLRQLARWLGAPWPTGVGLGAVWIKGELDWQEPGLAFDKAMFHMDGNEATGTLALSLEGQRPTVTGTLALKSLDITSYVAGMTGPQPAMLLPWIGADDAPLAMPLSRFFDADVRISAGRLLVGGLDAGRFAATLTLEDGRLLADVAELTIAGGRSSGQLTADFNGAQPRLALAGKLEELDAARASTILVGQAALEGLSTVTAELTAQGGTPLDLLRTASGKLSLSLQDGGRLGLDLKGLLGAAQSRNAEGWRAATRGHTSVERIDAKLSVQNGIVRSEVIEAVAGGSLISASGTVNLLANQVDMRLLLGAAPAVADAPPRPRREFLVLHGPWSAPTIEMRKPPDPG